MNACRLPSTNLSGLFDAFFSPKTAAEDWIAGQRAAAVSDVAHQRAILVAQMRQVASEATTEAAIKFAIAGVVSAALAFALYRVATRRRAARGE